jgi:hypothetical protein
MHSVEADSLPGLGNSLCGPRTTYHAKEISINGVMCIIPSYIQTGLMEVYHQHDINGVTKYFRNVPAIHHKLYVFCTQ